MHGVFILYSLLLVRPTRKVNLALCPGFQDLVICSCYFFLRDLEARAQNEFFRAFFRLPRKEKLHEVVDCSLWTPFSRCHTAGRMYTSDTYICFASKENGCCTVIIPLREVEFFVCLILGLYLPFSALSLCCHLTYLENIVWWKSVGCLCVSGLFHSLFWGSLEPELLKIWVIQNCPQSEVWTAAAGQNTAKTESAWPETWIRLPSQLHKHVHPAWCWWRLTWSHCSNSKATLHGINTNVELSLHRQPLANPWVLCQAVGQREGGDVIGAVMGWQISMKSRDKFKWRESMREGGGSRTGEGSCQLTPIWSAVNTRLLWSLN